MAEANYLVGAIVVYIGVIVAQAVVANLRYDPKTLLGARDDFAPSDVHLLRARRTLSNFNEALMIFAPLILIAIVTQRTSQLTEIGAALFFWGRLLYAPCYIAGVPVVRSVFWAVATLGSLLVLWEVLPFKNA